MKHAVPKAVLEVREQLLKNRAVQPEIEPPTANIFEFWKWRAADPNLSGSVFLDAVEYSEPAETGPRKTYTFKAFDRESDRLAAVFQGSGLGENSSIGYIGENIAEMHLTYTAIAKLGGVCAPLNPMDILEKWLITFRDCEAAAVVVQDKFYKTEKFGALISEMPSLKKVFVVGAGDALVAHSKWRCEVSLFSEALAHSPSTFAPPKALTWKRPFLLVYTSGTTGTPKGVVIALDTIWRCADSINQHYGLGPGDATYAQLSGFHVNHIVVSFWGALAGGYRCFMTNRFVPEKYFELLKSEKITVSSVVPTNLAYALRAELERGDIPRDAAFHAEVFRELTSHSCEPAALDAALVKCAGVVDPIKFYDVLCKDGAKLAPQPFSLAYAKCFQPRFQKRYGLLADRLVIICGAGDLALDLALQFSRFTGLQITQGWGMSEGTCYSSMNLPRQSWFLYWLTLGSIGLELSTTNMAIAKTDGELQPLTENGRLVLLTPEQMARGQEVGMIAMHGHVASLGYYNNEKVNLETHVDGWLLTGDAGCALFLKDAPGFKRFVADVLRMGAADFNRLYPFLDEKHLALLEKFRRNKNANKLLEAILTDHPELQHLPYYYIKGRIKDIIITKGQNIPCDDVEAGALKHPGVFEAVAVPIADIMDGEIPAIVVTRHPQAQLTAQELLHFCCQRDILPRLCWPVAAAIVEQLPKTPTGKYQRVRAREIFTGEALKAPFKTAKHQLDVKDLAISKDYDLKRRPKQV